VAGGSAPRLKVIGEGATLNDALDTMLVSSHAGALVVGRGNQLVGRVNVDIIMNAIQLLRSTRGSVTSDLDGVPNEQSVTRSAIRRVTS